MTGKNKPSGETLISFTEDAEDESGGHVIRVNDTDAPVARPALNFIDGAGVKFIGADDSGDNETEVTADLDIDNLAEIPILDGATDYVFGWDSSAGGPALIPVEDLPGGSVGGETNAVIRVSKWRMFT